MMQEPMQEFKEGYLYYGELPIGFRLWVVHATWDAMTVQSMITGD